MAGSIAAHTFRPRDLVGGHVVLDLVNTVTARDAQRVDWLDGYPRLLEWAALTGEFDTADLGALRQLAEAAPDEAASALERARELREALHALVTALIRQDAADAPDAAGAPERFEGHWKRAATAARFTLHGNTPQLRAGVEASGLDFLAHELALRAWDLLRSLPLERTRVCPGQRCGWVFVDSSRGGRRRWCDMATCGNSAKGRTHYRRTRTGDTDPQPPTR
ncbi:CGNR zinc finger domain-containing protein [Kitasatospora sp. NPDC005856]|uniref:CGNR zinc finger domain-containing protein n=1 Tax=Kitasatospora sp. NPDC005856 TaxID=3154566 RepID=UPI0033CB8620